MTLAGVALLAEIAGTLAGESWRDRAECKGMDPGIWFPQRGGDFRLAKRICDSCPVRQPCLDAALHYGDAAEDLRVTGIWASTSERQRQELRRARRWAS